jgi:hypothetical protein
MAPHVLSELSLPPFSVADLHWHTAPAVSRLPNKQNHNGSWWVFGRSQLGRG